MCDGGVHRDVDHVTGTGNVHRDRTGGANRDVEHVTGVMTVYTETLITWQAWSWCTQRRWSRDRCGDGVHRDVHHVTGVMTMYTETLITWHVWWRCTQRRWPRNRWDDDVHRDVDHVTGVMTIYTETLITWHVRWQCTHRRLSRDRRNPSKPETLTQCCLRRRPNIKTKFGERIVFAEITDCTESLCPEDSKKFPEYNSPIVTTKLQWIRQLAR